MLFKRGSSKADKLPDDVYIEFVRSLFDNSHVLLIGAACYALGCLMIFHATDNIVYIAFAFVLPAISIFRYSGIQNFFIHGGILDNVDYAKRLEQSYLLRGSLQGLALGTLCLVSIFVYPNAYAELSAMSLTSTTLITVVARNYASPRMVTIFAFTFMGPAALGLMLRMDIAHFVLGLMIIPTSIVVIDCAKQIRKVLLSAVNGQRRAREIAERFDRALNTMPQGLLMFDSGGRIIVANAEAATLLQVGSQSRLMGRSMNAVLLRIVAAGQLDKKQWRYATRQIISAMRQGFDRKLMIELHDGRWFELSTREGPQNIGVVLFDDVSARVRADTKINTMARFDGLTGLPNRAHVKDLIAARLDKGNMKRKCALAMFDVDDLKTVNDSLGHEVGDELIRQVGERLSALVPSDAIVGRFGSDDFLVYFDNVDSADLKLMTAVIRRLRDQVEIAGNRVRMQVSGGVVRCPVHSTNFESLLVKADLALSKAKDEDKGKDGWCIYEETIEKAFRRRQTLMADLRVAIETQSLRVVYQPIISMETMKIASCEALCRWEHPQLGAVSPAEFIPIAEEMGIISEISNFVLLAACQECTKWADQLSVSVNLSARDFADAGVVARVANALKASGLAPARLEIEVTETSVLEDKSQARRYVEELRSRGVRIALDDFGTGYSNLSYMHRLPLDKIKIDRSFLADLTEDPRSIELLSSIVKMARILGMSVTIEGVETFQQLKLLSARAKPDFVQGFLFGSALTGSGIETMSASGWPFPTPRQASSRRAGQH